MKLRYIIPFVLLASVSVIAQVGYSSNIGTSLSGSGGGGGAGTGVCPAGQVVTAVNAGTPTCVANVTPGTITASTPFEFSQTWNNAAVVFRGLNINITPTASATLSSLFAINQVGEGQAFGVVQNSASGDVGNVGIAVNQGTTGTANSFRFYIGMASANNLAFQVAPDNPGTRPLLASSYGATENVISNVTTRLNSVGIIVSSDGSYTFTDTAGNSGATKDTGLTRASAASVAVGNGAIGDFTGNLVATVVQTKTIFTVATLPTCNGAAEGSHASVSDANTPVPLANVAGLGAVHISVYCNGTNWIVQ